MTMWIPGKQQEKMWSSPALVIDKVLYEFDGPMIFTAWFGMFQALFSRIDENEQSELYAVGTVNTETITAIENGSLSVLGGLMSEPCFIMELDGINVKRYWNMDVDELPLAMLPASGQTLIPGMAAAPDSIEQVNSYFSVRFSGEKLNSKSMPFSTFKSLVDKFYDSSRKLIAPLALQNAKSATFDFRISEPAFGSLILSIESPSVKPGNVRRHLKKPDLGREVIEGLFDRSREDFFIEIGALIEETEIEGNIRQAAERHVHLLTNLQDLLPDEETAFSKLEFNALLEDKNISVVVNEETGERLKKAYVYIAGKPSELRGKINIINSKRRTFVIETAAGREITCSVENAHFEKLLESPSFRGETMAEVSGNLYRRPRRDYIIVDGEPKLFDHDGLIVFPNVFG